MKTLTIALCMLLVLPAGAQQITGPLAPNFYVPYGVRGVQPESIGLESSSDDMRIADPGQRRSPPMPRPYPMRRGRHRAFPPGYGQPSQPSDATAEAVVGAIIAAALLIALATGDH